MKEGLESVRGEVAGLLRLQMSPQDHEGGGLVRVYQVKGNQWEPVTEWFQGYRDVVQELIRRS